MKLKDQKLVAVEMKFLKLVQQMFITASEIVEDWEEFYPFFKREWDKSLEPFPCELVCDIDNLKDILSQFHILAKQETEEKEMVSHIVGEA